jgi:hypothetical protein
MILRLLHTEFNDTLYLGYGLLWPSLVWRPEIGAWARVTGPLEAGPVRLSEREAERCYPGSMAAPKPADVPNAIDVTNFDELLRLRGEIFDDYDNHTYRKAPEEEAAALEAFLQLMGDDWTTMYRTRVAARKLELAKSRAGTSA